MREFPRKRQVLREETMVFYPAIIGWTLLGVWIMNIRLRMRAVMDKISN